MLAEAGELAAAERHRVAAARTASTPEQHYLTVQAARLRARLDHPDVEDPPPGASYP